MFNITPIQKNNEIFFTIKSDLSGALESKTVSFDAFIDLMSSLRSDEIQLDTGYITENLKRKVITSNVERYLFSYGDVLVSPKIGNVDVVMLRKFTDEYFSVTTENNLTTIDNFTIKNLVFLVSFNKSENHLSYKVCFTKNGEIFAQDINDETVFFPSPFPNHFPDHICWGGTQHNTIIKEAARNSDVLTLERSPFVYLNSTFNYDLFNSFYGSSITQFIQSNSTLLVESLELKLGRVLEKRDEVISVFSRNHENLFVFFCGLKIIFDIPTVFNLFCNHIRNVNSRVVAGSFFKYGFSS